MVKTNIRVPLCCLVVKAFAWLELVPEPRKDQCGTSTDPDTMDAGVAVEDFINTGRTGRRNAIADISDSRAGTSSAAGMDFSFDKLSVTDSKQTPPGTDETMSPSSGESPNQPPKS